MGEVWRSWGGVLVVWAVAVPVLAGAAVWGVRLRVRHGRPYHRALRMTLGEVGVLGGTLPWVWMILTPRDAPGGVNLVPFRDIVQTLAGPPSAAVVQVAANLVVFVPLGFCLPLRVPRLAGVRRMLALGAAVSAALEAAQYAFDLGRVASVDDVVMNATGAALGAAALAVARAGSAARRVRRARRSSSAVFAGTRASSRSS
ncbi:MAG: VanZ family protein [Streptomycetaceae bacterium]|nr:VanZ family protein [Streptomycetaceae bacterium]